MIEENSFDDTARIEDEESRIGPASRSRVQEDIHVNERIYTLEKQAEWAGWVIPVIAIGMYFVFRYALTLEERVTLLECAK